MFDIAERQCAVLSQYGSAAKRPRVEGTLRDAQPELLEFAKAALLEEPPCASRATLSADQRSQILGELLTLQGSHEHRTVLEHITSAQVVWNTCDILQEMRAALKDTLLEMHRNSERAYLLLLYDPDKMKSNTWLGLLALRWLSSPEFEECADAVKDVVFFNVDDDDDIDVDSQATVIVLDDAVYSGTQLLSTVTFLPNKMRVIVGASTTRGRRAIANMKGKVLSVCAGRLLRTYEEFISRIARPEKMEAFERWLIDVTPLHGRTPLRKSMDALDVKLADYQSAMRIFWCVDSMPDSKPVLPEKGYYADFKDWQATYALLESLRR